ncbi:MAG: hypothetical protein VZR00_01615 [Lachnospiraceae bacterium]|nr:hypothetical protein [Lachnospiraceae bacterium]MEE3460573.1 hypothetical protein [Lachnospiraceae bacterium]
MKKILLIALTAVMSLGLTLTACGKKDGSSSSEASSMSESSSAETSGYMNNTSEDKSVNDDPTASSEVTSESPSPSENWPEGSSEGKDSAGPGTADDPTFNTGENNSQDQKDIESSLDTALDSLTGWGSSAGSSLRCAQASVTLMQWVKDHDVVRIDKNELRKYVSAWYKSQSTDEQPDIMNNIYGVCDDADQILGNFKDFEPTLEDAGVASAAKDVLTSDTIQADWLYFRDVLFASL